MHGCMGGGEAGTLKCGRTKKYEAVKWQIHDLQLAAVSLARLLVNPLPLLFPSSFYCHHPCCLLACYVCILTATKNEQSAIVTIQLLPLYCRNNAPVAETKSKRT